MAKYYKLIDAENSSRTFHLPHTENGKAVYQFTTLHPGQKYVGYIDDPVFMRAIQQDACVMMDYTEARLRALDACGARYEESRTKCCGGRRKLKVWLVEVVE